MFRFWDFGFSLHIARTLTLENCWCFIVNKNRKKKFVKNKSDGLIAIYSIYNTHLFVFQQKQQETLLYSFYWGSSVAALVNAVNAIQLVSCNLIWILILFVEPMSGSQTQFHFRFLLTFAFCFDFCFSFSQYVFFAASSKREYFVASSCLFVKFWRNRILFNNLHLILFSIHKPSTNFGFQYSSECQPVETCIRSSNCFRIKSVPWNCI